MHLSRGKSTGVGCHCLLLVYVQHILRLHVCSVVPSSLQPQDCSQPGSSVHGIFQARVLEWGAIAFSDVCVYMYLNIYCEMISTVRSVNISITSQNYDSFLCVWSTLERSTLAWHAGRWRHPGGGLEIRSAWSWRLGQQGGAWLTLGGSALGAAGSQSGEGEKRSTSPAAFKPVIR